MKEYVTLTSWPVLAILALENFRKKFPDIRLFRIIRKNGILRIEKFPLKVDFHTRVKFYF